MKLVLFTKLFSTLSLPSLVSLAHETQADGFDLCVRAGHPVNPENVTTQLARAAALCRTEGLSVGMVTAATDLLLAEQPLSPVLLAAMDRADVRLLKLGYFRCDARTMNYWTEVERIRRALAGWEALGRRYGVRLCYHTHSGDYMGRNCAALAHLIRGFDPTCIGAYLDPGHLVVEGEEFGAGLAMLHEQLSAVALKDILVARKPEGLHGAKKKSVVAAGQGMVNWSSVFAELARLNFAGPLSVHCEVQASGAEAVQIARTETRFFRQQLNAISAVSAGC